MQGRDVALQRRASFEAGPDFCGVLVVVPSDLKAKDYQRIAFQHFGCTHLLVEDSVPLVDVCNIPVVVVPLP